MTSVLVFDPSLFSGFDFPKGLLDVIGFIYMEDAAENSVANMGRYSCCNTPDIQNGLGPFDLTRVEREVGF